MLRANGADDSVPFDLKSNKTGINPLNLWNYVMQRAGNPLVACGLILVDACPTQTIQT